jgi:WD40 repeat protein
LWDGGSGAPMAVLIGHSDWVEGARVLLDGRLMSWSKDGTLRLWNGRTGASLDVVPKHRARFEMPEIHREWRIAEQPARVRPLGIAEGAPDGRSWHIAEQPARVQPLGIAEGATGAQLHLDAKASVPPVHWHADGDWIVDTLCDEGALELRRGKQSAVLHLHHGRRRVSLEEACRVIDATRTPPFESELADPQVFEDARSQKR